MLSLLLAVPSCTYSFWHGVIPTSYFIFNDFYTCIYIGFVPACIPSGSTIIYNDVYTLSGCCMRELHSYLCPIWPGAVYCYFKRNILFTEFCMIRVRGSCHFTEFHCSIPSGFRDSYKCIVEDCLSLQLHTIMFTMIIVVCSLKSIYMCIPKFLLDWLLCE